MEQLSQGTANSILQPMSTQSVVERIVERITNAIIQGELKAGDKIPTELELSESIGVGRNSVREAIKILVSLGILQIRRAEGTFVCDHFNDRMLDPLIYGLILEKDASKEIIELRRTFETGILELAVRRATAEHVICLEEELDRLKTTIRNPAVMAEHVLEIDMAFHRILVRILGNNLIDRVSNMIERLTIPSRRRTINQILASGNGQRMIDLHAELVDLVRQHDTAGITGAMERHFSFWVHEVGR
jgi:GntR family transcriptional repressor for pyruvate dehydrogenase complex